jgi:hypothetical protein
VSYAGVSSVLLQLENTPLVAFTVSFLAAFFAILSYRKIPNIEIASRISLPFNVVLIRAATAIGIVLLVTYFAATISPNWSGLFASFLIAILPVLLIIHHTYSANQTWPIIKNYPVGMGGQVSFGLSCYYLYPLIGVKLGTLVALGAALLYLATVALVIA